MATANRSKCIAEDYLSAYYSKLNEIKRLQRELNRIMLQCAPCNKLTAGYDNNKGGATTRVHNSAIRTFADINQLKQLIAAKLAIVEDILDALDNMGMDERLALIMRYVDSHSVKVICNTLNYSSRQSVYNLLDSAGKKFSKNMGINA